MVEQHMTCARCEQPIQPGQLYIKTPKHPPQPGPIHVACPSAREIAHRRRMGRA